jgi:hypothetical protein
MNIAMRRRRFAGMPKSSTVANAAPDMPNVVDVRTAALVDPVVAMVTVEVAAAVPLTAIDAGMEQVGGSLGLLMLVVTAQVRLICPVKPLEGVAVMVAELPVVAPALMVRAPLLVSAKVPLAPDDPPVTVTLTAVVEVVLPVLASVPVTVTT